jgi:phosphoglycerol transferase MdoB-like AlkP superfamily enzyme
MKKRLIALLWYSAFWMIFFFFARLIFLLSQYSISFHESTGGLLGTFIHGIKLDISTTGYYLLVPFLLSIPSLIFAGNWYRYIIKGYTYFLAVLSSLIVVGDASLYSYWGFRMDYTPVFYLKTPGEAMASVSTLKVVFLFLSVTLIAALFIYLYNRFIDKYFRNLERTHYLIPKILVLLLLTGALVIPIRGGFGIAPINAGTVYFSPKMFLNHSAINVVWNVGTSAFTQKPVENPYIFMPQDQAAQKFDSLSFKVGPAGRKVLNTDRPNVLMIVLESFSGYLIGPLGGDSLVTPNFNRYSREGILFTRFYCSGPRTDKALPAILDGYPAQPAQSIIKEPKKTQSLPSLVRILMSKGYSSSFWYGGEINFANFNSFVIGSGFQSIITKDYFDPKDFNSKWGVHDHILFNSLMDSMKAPRQPFFNVVLTLSSHEPFEVPEKPVFEGNDILTLYRNSVHYTDRVVGSFLDWAKTQDWWKNTLIILVADHGARITPDIEAYSQKIFHIPMLWTGGALAETGLKVKKTGGQIDIPLTVLKQLGIEGSFPFGKDLFSDEAKSFAFYSYNDGFGFVTDSSSVAFDNKPRTVVEQAGSHPEAAEENGKAFLQVLFEDYLKR